MGETIRHPCGTPMIRRSRSSSRQWRSMLTAPIEGGEGNQRIVAGAAVFIAALQ